MKTKIIKRLILKYDRRPPPAPHTVLHSRLAPPPPPPIASFYAHRCRLQSLPVVITSTSDHCRHLLQSHTPPITVTSSDYSPLLPPPPPLTACCDCRHLRFTNDYNGTEPEPQGIDFGSIDSSVQSQRHGRSYPETNGTLCFIHFWIDLHIFCLNLNWE